MKVVREEIEPHFGLQRSKVLPGFALREYALPSRHTLPQHEHPDPMLVFMFGGGFRGAMRRDGYAIAPGESVIAPAARNHRGHVAPEGSLAVLVTSNAPRVVEFRRLGLDQFRRFVGTEPRRLARSVHRELRTSDSASAIALEGAVLDILAPFARAPTVREAERTTVVGERARGCWRRVLRRMCQ